MSDERGEDLEAFVERRGVEIESVLRGEHKEPHETYASYEWDVTLKHDGETFRTRYYTGIGRVRWKTGANQANVSRGRPLGEKLVRDGQEVPFHIFKSAMSRRGGIAPADKEWVRSFFEPVPPDAANVLNSLVWDMRGADETFEGWCENIGESTDSRRALDIYLKCQSLNRLLPKLFGTAFPELLECEPL